MKKRYSAFDYSVQISRRSRYLVVSCPEFGFQIASECLLLDSLTPEAVGAAVIQAFERINRKLYQLAIAGVEPVKPSALRRRRGALSSSEAADVIGISGETLRKLVMAGKLKAEKTPGGHLRVTEESLTEYLLKA